jgi:hypothetical protein
VSIWLYFSHSGAHTSEYNLLRKSWEAERSLPVGLVAVEEYSKTILMSSRVKGIKPLSGILISYVDTGKSESLLQFQGNEGVVTLSDATSFGIVNNLISGISKGEISHIIIPDFLKITERSRRVASELVSLLNSLAEEGFMGSLTYNIKIVTDRPLCCGFLTSITIDKYQAVKRGWGKIGFSSRIIPLFFGYEKEDMEKASKDILHEKKVFKKITLPEIEPVEVDVKDDFREDVGRTADFTAGINNDFTSFRTKRNMLGFVKSHAVLRGDSQVKEEDITFLRSLVPFWFDPVFGNDCDYHIIQNASNTSKDIVEKLKDKYSQATVYRRIKELKTKGLLVENEDILCTAY